MEDLEKVLGEKKFWGSDDSFKRRDAIAKMLAFLDECKALSKHEDLMTDATYATDATYRFLLNLLPYKIRNYVVSLSQLESSIGEKFDVLYKALQKHRDGTVWLLDMSNI